MDSMTDITTAATSPQPPAVPDPFTPPDASAAPAAIQRQHSGHPLIWAALLVWLSVEAIGDGLLALQTVLTTATASRGTTPTVTPS
jgi:hypothetical protein